MNVNGTNIGIAALFLVMFAAVILQVLVFLDPQNNLVTGGVTAGSGFISQGSLLLVLVITGFVLGVQGFRYKKSK